MAAGGLAATLFPGVDARHLAAAMPGLPPHPSPPDEAYWQQVKRHFPLREGRVPMNTANLAPAPRSVIERVVEVTYDVDGDVSFQNRGPLGEKVEAVRARIAADLRADPDELALLRNTSEANNVVVSGLPLGTGDEVLVYDQNHPTNAVAWDVRAARAGFRVRRVGVPTDPGSPDDLRDAFVDALGPETRVVALTDISNVTGIRLPVEEICRACRERGIHAHVDGAQSFGAVQVDLHRLGCDTYTSSAHKWYMGPKEAGILYVRQDRIDGIWPLIVGVGWGSEVGTSARGARKFETLGQRNDATLVALGAAAEFREAIGPERIEARVMELAAYLKEGLAGVPGIRFVTPRSPEMSAGVVITRPEGMEGRRLFEAIYEEYGIAGAATGGFRLCPHIFNTRADVERAVEGVGALIGREP
jgi:isopenicillin-N epimerase